MQFADRHDAGKKLAGQLTKFKNKKNVVVLGIPRGGVEVAFEVARILKVQLNVAITKKIGHPSDPEFAIGAVSPGNYIVDEDYRKQVGEDYIRKTFRELNKEIKRGYKEYTKGRMPELQDKIGIIVDDGLATGFTMLAAIKYAKSRNPKKVIVAVPVAAQDSFEKIKKEVDKIVCLHVPIFFGSVGSFYQNFAQLDDKRVGFYLEEARKYC